MLRDWLLLLLLVPGWLLPAGASVPLCGCLFGLGDAPACCAVEPEPRAAPACCAQRGSAPAEQGDGARVEGAEACTCAVAVPAHEADRACAPSTPVTPAAPAVAGAARLERPPYPVPLGVHAERERPRGPSPGRAIPLPLRL
jgi:hypothetical protein